MSCLRISKVHLFFYRNDQNSANILFNVSVKAQIYEEAIAEKY